MDRLSRAVRFDGPPRPGDLLRLMQDLAGADADRRGCGRSDLLRHGCVWVLIKNRLSAARWPEAGETLTLTTWPMQGRRGFYPRYFELNDASGAVLLRAESVWAIIEVESRTMVTLEALGAEMAGVEEGEFRPPARLRLPAGGEVYDFTPRPEQIDVNRHMNNAAYLDAAEELLPASFAGREIAAVAIDYEHELPPDCRAQIRIAPEPDACSFEGTLEDKICFRLRIEYK